jgi:hypothetical protein
MRFYKFNRNRSLDPMQKYRISAYKANYLASRGKLKVLDSIFTENKTWGALHKAWKGYTIAKNKFELARMEYYARVIQKLQNELGLQVSSFPDLNIYPAEEEGYSQEDDITTFYDVDYVSKQEMKEW